MTQCFVDVRKLESKNSVRIPEGASTVQRYTQMTKIVEARCCVLIVVVLILLRVHIVPCI